MSRKIFITKVDQVFYKLERENKLRDQGNRCYYCGRPLSMKEATMDHVNPIVKVKYHSSQNAVVCCYSCNQDKGAQNRLEFRASAPELEMFKRIERRIDRACWSLDVKCRIPFNKWLKSSKSRLTS